MQAVQHGSGVKTVRLSGPGDVMSGASSLLAMGARKVQGVRSVLQGTPPVRSLIKGFL